MPEERFDEIDLTAHLASIRAALAEVKAKHDNLREEMRAAFAMILKRLDDHAIPGEAADRPS